MFFLENGVDRADEDEGDEEDEGDQVNDWKSD